MENVFALLLIFGVLRQCSSIDANCTSCNPFRELFESLNTSSLILADPSTIASIHKACETYDECRDCDKNVAFSDFICKSILPNVDNGTCWKADACKLNKADKSTRPSCQFLAALQLQIDCALEQSETCTSPSVDFLRQARTDNFNLLTTMDCNDDNEATSIPKCSAKQNLNAKVCAIDLKYPMNGTFWISNDTMVNELCDKVSKHQKCIESTMDQNDDTAAQMPCLFDDWRQNFPTFLQTLCNDDVLRYQIHQSCKLTTMDFNFTPQDTICSLYKSSIAYMDSLKNTQCDDKIDKIKSNLVDDAKIFKCFDDCSTQLSAQCKKFRLNFVSITSMSTKDYCSSEQLLKSCIACNFVDYPTSVESIQKFVCGPGANDYEKSKACLFSTSNDQNVKSCLNTNVTCSVTNKLINCTFPSIDKACGREAAQFHLNIMHNFAMTSISGCHLEFEVPEPEDALSTILAYESCTKNEKEALNKCAEPFQKLLSDLESKAKGGLSSIIGSLKNVTQAVKDGCKLRDTFQHCVKSVLSPSTSCQISSCSIKVGDTACADNVTAKSLEKDIRCMFTLITDSKFQQCMKIFPKDTFNNLARLKPYFPQFIACIREPVLRKCGERSWQLARSFTPGKNDSACILDFDHVTNMELTTQAILNDTFSDTTALCTTERLDQFEDCANVLGDYKPMPIMLFDDASKIDKACSLYNGYQNCLKKYKCHYPLAEGYKSLLYNVCTTYYDTYKTNAVCLKRVANNNKVQICVNTFRSTDLRSSSSGLADLGCKTVTDLLKCAGDATDFACGHSGLDFLYNIYRPFAQKFSTMCSPSRMDIGPPVKDCTREQRDIYYECRNRIMLNPINVLNDTLNHTCSYFYNEFQTCINQAPCLPQPAHQAFNDTMEYLCSTKNDFDTFNPCLSQVAAKSSADRCSSMFNNITWDDPGKVVCRKLNQALDCGYPLINQTKCHQDSLIWIYNVYSLMAMRYRTGCVLNVPPNVHMPDQTKNVTLAQPIFLTDNMPTTPSVEVTTKGAMGLRLQWLSVIVCLMLVLCSLL